MTKARWQQHIADAGPHDRTTCPECRDRMKTRMKTRRATMRRRERDDAYRSCGLVKVRGALGGVYWE